MSHVRVCLLMVRAIFFTTLALPARQAAMLLLLHSHQQDGTYKGSY